jgi:hypothetical protein
VKADNGHNRQHMATPATRLRRLWPSWPPYAPHRQRLWPSWPSWPPPRRVICAIGSNDGRRITAFVAIVKATSRALAFRASIENLISPEGRESFADGPGETAGASAPSVLLRVTTFAAAFLMEARKWGLTFDTSRLADFGGIVLQALSNLRNSWSARQILSRKYNNDVVDNSWIGFYFKIFQALKSNSLVRRTCWPILAVR